MNPLSIYIHIPFCVSKCAYCDFISYRIGELEVKEGIHAYIEALKSEINSYKSILSQHEVKTIYFGGGTPSAIDGRYIHEIVDLIKMNATISNDVEITVEINPGTLNQDKMNHYLASGVNRISMGLQTTNDRLLTSIGRIHSTNDFITTYHAIREAGFKNISLDVMFGLPGQTIDDIDHAIRLISKLKPEHVSAYGLKIEEGTPLFYSYESGKVELPDEATERKMYHKIIRDLDEIGLKQYELSNFALPGYASKHNLTYWKNMPYLGLGVSSHSKVNQTRFANVSDINVYVENLKQKKSVLIESDYIDHFEDLFETIILRLRLNEGINIHEINDKYNIDFLVRYHPALIKLQEERLIDVSLSTIKLTEMGKDLANQVFLQFMIDM